MFKFIIKNKIKNILFFIIKNVIVWKNSVKFIDRNFKIWIKRLKNALYNFFIIKRWLKMVSREKISIIWVIKYLSLKHFY